MPFKLNKRPIGLRIGQFRLQIRANSGYKYTPKQATNTRQNRLQIHAKTGYKYTPKQATNTRQIRLQIHAKLGGKYKHAKSGYKYMPNQVANIYTPNCKSGRQIHATDQDTNTRQIRLKIYAKLGYKYTPN